MKCPDDILEVLQKNGHADCWVWDESKSNGKRADVTRFDWGDNYNPFFARINCSRWWKHA